MEFDGLDASSNKAADDESATINATSNFKAGRIAIQIGTIKVVVVELVITLANIMAKNPNMDSITMLFNCRLISIWA